MCDSVHRGGGLWQEEPHPRQGDPPGKETPWVGRPPQAGRTPPGRETPTGQGDPPAGRPPGQGTPGIRSMSGRYASYWNAFLFEWRIQRLGRGSKNMKSIRSLLDLFLTYFSKREGGVDMATFPSPRIRCFIVQFKHVYIHCRFNIRSTCTRGMIKCDLSVI